ncbi:MAG: hypothetical protein EXR67_06900 [Dehalococcoidia bacterium]|nr:hypothetical protein [Dehalococcoidia bacterium]
MQDKEREENPSPPAEISFCVYPHLKEYLVIDARPGVPNAPQVHSFSTDDVFNDEFYKELEDAFSTFIRHREEPFASLMTLSERVEYFTREFGMEAMLRALSERASVDHSPQIALLIFAGPLLQTDGDDLREILEEVLPPHMPQSFVENTMQNLRRLQALEQKAVASQQQVSAIQDLLADSENFRVIWQRSAPE